MTSLIFKWRLTLVSMLLASAAVLPSGSWADEATTLTLEPGGPHRLWLTDTIFMMSSTLFDADTASQLAMLTGGARWSHVKPFFSPDGAEIYNVETHYDRTWRGKRTDIVAVYDGRTLELRDEIQIPPKHALYPAMQVGSSAQSDDGRFLAAFNLTPSTSVTIVDVRKRKVVEEVSTPGCYMVFAGGKRRFMMLCGDGSALVLAVDEKGTTVTRQPSPPFFEPDADPVTERGARLGNTWFFASYDGYLHGIDVGSSPAQPQAPWSLLTDEERAAGWKIGGTQHLAISGPLNLLYSLVHKDSPDKVEDFGSRKDYGSAIWIYDMKSKKRVSKIELETPTEEGANRIIGGVHLIAVSPDENPLLYTIGGQPPELSVYEGQSFKFVRKFPTGIRVVVGLDIARDTTGGQP